ncbi:hypothetical protein SOCE26_085870 [Sorangium cellulosum]|uniref:Secreted protein n=1 Tax=Sorangium cellulosum TaxID=56 RepID=A0A2L0F678_SORCE|nr:hypothetical protein [Sorangium cellulosum]AUX47075.1 hypothetical protein SOCE26_085870 [Sorangium cellulosum]
MRSPLHASCACLSAALLLAALPAAAVDLPNVGGEPMAVDVVNTAAAVYHFDNRNDNPNITARHLDDNYGELLERLDAQINWWRLQLGARINASFYPISPSATDIDLQRKVLRKEVNFGLDDAARELHSRYRTTVYPAKLWLTYTQPGVEATVGDFYAQLGRGLVFSVRKLDELAIDTTVRGGRLVLDKDFQVLRLEATAFAGQMNPLRVDEASGRRLHGDGSPLFFLFPGRDSAGDLRDLRTQEVTAKARPNYLEDTALGGRLEVGVKGVEIAANGSLLLRKSYTEELLRCQREHGGDEGDAVGACAAEYPEFELTGAPHAQRFNEIRTFSGSVSVPSVANHGDVYVEVAGQQLRERHRASAAAGQGDLSGYAVYAAANARGGPVAFLLEGKHYRRFFSLSSNIDTNALSNVGFNAPEFAGVAYSQPPTAEPIYTKPLGAPNVCVTGGRGRVDYRFNRSTAVYAWLGRYVSFSEREENNDCKTDDRYRTGTWDTAVGAEIDLDSGRSHVRAWAGGRQVDAAAVDGLFYSESYVRYDVVKHLAGPFSLQVQGNNQRQYKTDAYGFEGENYIALQWSPHLTAILGHEYTSPELGGCEVPEGGGICHYFNGGLQWKSGGSGTALQQVFDTAQLFVGQRRGGLRCVSGVCRVFPSFEGARLELVSRF